MPLLAVAAGILARRRRSWTPLLDIAVVYGTAVFLHGLGGQLVHRHRPPAADWLASAQGWSYPSGHTTQAVAAWGILAALTTVGASRRTRALAGSVATGIAVLVATSRVYLGVHWATDVLAAAVMSLAVLAGWSATRCLLPHRPIIGPSRRRAVVIIPSYEETDNVYGVLDRASAVAPEVDILVVDDAVQMGADLSHPLEHIPAPRHGLESADFVIGSRCVSGGSVLNWTLGRRVISRAGNLYVRMILELPALVLAWRRYALIRRTTHATSDRSDPNQRPAEHHALA